jgi:hypothetical protein
LPFQQFGGDDKLVFRGRFGIELGQQHPRQNYIIFLRNLISVLPIRSGEAVFADINRQHAVVFLVIFVCPLDQEKHESQRLDKTQECKQG